MKTSKTTHYALTCLKELSSKFGEFVQVIEIARKHNLPPAYCQKILLTLSRAGIVESVKGQGFTLMRPAEMITTLDVLKALSPAETKKSSGDNDYARNIINQVLTERLNKTLSELSVSDVVAVN